MTDLTLTTLGFHAGIWNGRITGPVPNEIEVLCADETLEGVEIAPDGKNAALISVPILSDHLNEGINTFLVVNKETKSEIGGFGIAIAYCGDDNIRAEVQLLRAELNLLKKALRSHVADG